MYKGLARETRRASTVHRKRLSQWSLFSRIIQRFLNHIYVYHGLAQVLISTSTVRSRPRVLRFCAQDWFDPDDALSPTWRAWCQKEMLKVWRTRHSVFVAKRKVPVNFGGVLIFVDGERSPEDSLQEAACRNQKKRVLGPWTSFGHLCAKDHIFSFFLFTLFHKSQKERCDDTLWEWNAPNHTFLKRAWSQSASFLNSFHVFATCFLVLFFLNSSKTSFTSFALVFLRRLSSEVIQLRSSLGFDRHGLERRLLFWASNRGWAQTEVLVNKPGRWRAHSSRKL